MLRVAELVRAGHDHGDALPRLEAEIGILHFQGQLAYLLHGFRRGQQFVGEHPSLMSWRAGFEFSVHA